MEWKELKIFVKAKKSEIGLKAGKIYEVEKTVEYGKDKYLHLKKDEEPKLFAIHRFETTE